MLPQLTERLMKDLPININLALDAYQLVRSISSMGYEDCAEFLMMVDLDQADVGFTELLINRLVKSLKREIDAGCPESEINLPFIDWDKVQ